jgi:3-oxoacyl-[acyl-carrier-protein] synthase-3
LPRLDPVSIRAIRYALPAATVDLAGLADGGLLDTPAPVLAEFGFGRAHISDKPAHTLALEALQDLLDGERIAPESIDAVFYAGAIASSHAIDDGASALAAFHYPATWLQYECGLVNATAIGVSQAGCTGLMSAVALAADHLQANPDAARAVCVSADVLPPGAKREIIYNVVSDGACAVLVERGGARNRILAHRRITKGYYWNAAQLRQEIVAAYFPTARTIVIETLAGLGLAPGDVAAVIPHNVSLRSWQILLPMIGIPVDRLFADNIASKGHVIAADNFINLADALAAGQIAMEDRLLLFNFGFGANWSCMVLAA